MAPTNNLVYWLFSGAWICYFTWKVRDLKSYDIWIIPWKNGSDLHGYRFGISSKLESGGSPLHIVFPQNHFPEYCTMDNLLVRGIKYTDFLHQILTWPYFLLKITPPYSLYQANYSMDKAKASMRRGRKALIDYEILNWIHIQREDFKFYLYDKNTFFLLPFLEKRGKKELFCGTGEKAGNNILRRKKWVKF